MADQSVPGVTSHGFGEPLEGETWDDFLIRVFERFDGSVYGDELFPSDANPQVGIEIEAHDPEA